MKRNCTFKDTETTSKNVWQIFTWEVCMMGGGDFQSPKLDALGLKAQWKSYTAFVRDSHWEKVCPKNVRETKYTLISTGCKIFNCIWSYLRVVCLLYMGLENWIYIYKICKYKFYMCETKCHICLESHFIYLFIFKWEEM